MKPEGLFEMLSGPEGKYLSSVLGGRDEERERYRLWLAEQGDERAELFAIEDALARRGECIALTMSSWTRISREKTSCITGRADPIATWAERVFPDERGDG